MAIIAFAGASGTGKSTLAQHIYKTEEGFSFTQVGARSIASEMGLASPYDVDAYGRRLEFQKRLQEAKIENAVAISRADMSLITDRTTLDELAYTILHLNGGVPEDYASRAMAHMARYDIVFFCAMQDFFDLADDPVRVKDREYHQNFQYILSALLSEAAKRYRGLRVLTVQGHNLDLRKDFVTYETRLTTK